MKDKSCGFDRIARDLLPIVGLCLFVSALWVLHRELKDYHIREILFQLTQIPIDYVAGALLLTLSDYFVLTLYDFLALKSIDHPLDYRDSWLVSFISFAFSHNVGFSLVSGGSVRYRIYTSLGLAPMEIARVIIFTGLTFWLGYSFVGGAAFLFAPLPNPSGLHIPFGSVRILGGIFLTPGIMYMAFSLLRHSPMTIRGTTITPYRSSIAVPQLLIASADWILAASAMFILIKDPSGIHFSHFLGIFMVAQLSGVVSQVPGGLGVFETIMILLMPPTIDRHFLMGNLLVYRGIYYIMPFFTAILLLGLRETGIGGRRLMEGGRNFSSALLPLVPFLFSIGTFIAGAVLLISGSLPVSAHYMLFLKKYIPLTMVEVSHFLSAMTGMGLLFLSRGLMRKIDTAWLLTCLLLAFGIVFSIFRGSHYVEIIILAAMMITLVPARKSFARKGMLLGDMMSLRWIISIALVVIATAWLGFFSYRHVDYSTELWWKFAFESNAPRFLRAQAGVLISIFVIAMKQLLGRARIPETEEGTDWHAVESLVSLSTRSDTALAFLGDKKFYFSSSKESMIMYGTRGKNWISMGDPVGNEDEWPELLWDFRERAYEYSANTVFYQVSASNIVNYVDMGLILVKLGEVGKVDLAGFSLEGSSRKKFRWILRKAEKEGLSFRVVTPPETDSLLDDIESVSSMWLADKHTREKGFSLGFFNRDYLRRFPLGIVEKDSSIVAFVNLWTGSGKQEISPDLMRYASGAPAEVMDYLFLKTMLWSKEEGYGYFNLGMAPLSGLEGHKMAPLWHKFGNFLYRHGEYFYNFQGLRAYKEKFSPRWEPRYLAFPKKLSLPGVLADISSLISGGISGILGK